MKVLIAGGSGFIGQHLAKHLQGRGYAITVWTRNIAQAKEKYDAREIDHEGIEFIDNLSAADGADVVVNLVGERLDRKRWSATFKQALIDSRVKPTETLVAWMHDANIGHFISGSAIGYYGNRGDAPLSEDSPSGTDFAAELCETWERAALQAPVPTQRVRIGVVLSHHDGAMTKLLPLFKRGLGGRLGNGQQYFSWIHLNDIVAILTAMIEKQLTAPVYNATAPEPVSNAEFTQQLAASLGKRTFLPVPSFSLKLMSGQMAEILLGGQRVLPAAAQTGGFTFKYPTLVECLRDVVEYDKR